MGDSLTSDLGSIFNTPDNDRKSAGPPESASQRRSGQDADRPRRKKSYKKNAGTTGKEPLPFVAGTVTAVKPQAKNAARVSVFIDDAFSFGCYKSVWRTFGVEKGEAFSQAQYDELANEEQHCKLQHYWMDLLSRRNHSAGELKRKALQKGYDAHHFDALIEEFRAKKFIDERAFANRLAEEMRERKRWGDQRIRAALMQKGLPGPLIEQALEQTRRDDVLGELKALTLKNRRRLSREADITKRKKKLFDYLVRKGHAPGLILTHIEELLACLEQAQ